MFLASDALTDGGTLRADVCVIGAGAAGITLAREFLDTPFQVVLLEGGGPAADAGGDGIYKVVAGSPPALSVDPSRTCSFGGNTNHWAANCRPLDEADFEPRDWIPHSGWPIRRQQLLPYYERAQGVCGLGELRLYDVDACRANLRCQPIDVDPSTLSNRILQVCPIPSFAALYGRSLDAADNVRVVLRARAIRFRTSAATDRVQAVEIAGSDGRRSRVEANTFVLAAGGVENAALLLRSNDVSRGGLGNDCDRVGRFFMEHWYVDILLEDKPAHDLSFYTQRESVDSTTVWGQLTLSDALMRTERVPGLSFWFPPTPPQEAAPARVGIRRVLRRVKRRILGGRSRPSQFLRVQIEQVPDPGNRISLRRADNGRRTALEYESDGRRNASLTLRLGDDERRAHVRSIERATAALGMNGRGLARRMESKLDAGSFDFFWHHTGTTRMHDDPAHGVVDRNCRVHGVSNLFVAGSSVFPTGGTAAPTLTIVALALRLADHLRHPVA